MKLGAVFPTTELGKDPVAIRDFAQAAESLGYTRLLTFDHVLGVAHENRDPQLSGPYTQDDPFHEPMVLLGFLAACTSSIELQVAVMVLPQRQTCLVAKQVAEVDVLSGGRFVLSVGTGWNHVEYESLGVEFATRGRRLDEQITLLRRLWREELVEFHGEFHDVERAGISPRPSNGTVPLYFGGGADVSLRRAASIGDGFTFGTVGAHTYERAERLAEMLREKGRDPDVFPMEAMVDYHHGAGVWADAAEDWSARGGTLLSIRTMTPVAERREQGPRLVGPSQHIAALEDFSRAMS